VGERTEFALQQVKMPPNNKLGEVRRPSPSDARRSTFASSAQILWNREETTLKERGQASAKGDYFAKANKTSRPSHLRGESFGCGWMPRYALAYESSVNTSGFCSAMRNKATAGPLGLRRPCSQS